MLSSEQILEEAAADGSIDIGEWPRVLESLLKRLHHIVHHDFPLPPPPAASPIPPTTIDPEVVASTPPAAASSSQSSTKENDAPTDIAAVRRPMPPSHVNSNNNNNHNNNNNNTPQPGHASDGAEEEPSPLPPDLLSLFNTSTHALETEFAESPPYTIQRLAELVLYPKKHYRFLPAYLRALDRLVCVSSPLSHFPLPALNPGTHGGFLTNGDVGHANGTPEREGLGLGSDESLGGALLTPIPWLRNNALSNVSSSTTQNEGELRSESTETIDGPNGAGSIETVSVTVNGVASATSAAHTSPAPAPAPSSPTLSDQSDASSSSSSGTTEAQLREQGAVTQGELLRQEQEAGVIPITQSSPRRALMAAGAVAVGREAATTTPQPSTEPTEERADEVPHARGPEEIGVEDMGPQHAPADAGLDMEAAVGRERSKSPQPAALSPRPAPEAEAEAKAAAEDDAGAPGKDPADVDKEVEKLREAMDLEREGDVKKDEDGDVFVADVEGQPPDEEDSDSTAH